MAHDPEALRAIVREGALSIRGMPQFDDLTDQQVNDIYMAVQWYSREAALGRSAIPEDGRQF